MPEEGLGGRNMEGTRNRGREESDKGREKEKGEMSS